MEKNLHSPNSTKIGRITKMTNKTLKQVFRHGLNILSFGSEIIMTFGCLGNNTVRDYMVVAAWCSIASILLAFGYVAGGGK